MENNENNIIEESGLDNPVVTDPQPDVFPVEDAPQAEPQAVEAPEAPATPGFCPTCGATLSGNGRFCPSCGANLAVTPQTNSSIDEFNRNLEDQKKKKKKFLTIGLPAIAAAAVLVIVLASIFFFIPNSKYNEAISLYNAGEYAAAMELFTELGNFRDSAQQVEICDTAMKQATYDRAMELFDDQRHGEAIKLLETLGDFGDSKAKIEEIKADYKKNAQIAYALFYRGYGVDQSLGSGVAVVLSLAEIYDAPISTAMSKLYSGSAYEVWYYWSRNYYGYGDVVSAELAESFVEVLELSNDNFDLFTGAIAYLADPPEEYEDLYDDLKTLYNAYDAYHEFINTHSSVGSDTYESRLASKASTVNSADSDFTKKYSYIKDKVSEYSWS